MFEGFVSVMHCQDTTTFGTKTRHCHDDHIRVGRASAHLTPNENVGIEASAAKAKNRARVSFTVHRHSTFCRTRLLLSSSALVRCVSPHCEVEAHVGEVGQQ